MNRQAAAPRGPGADANTLHLRETEAALARAKQTLREAEAQLRRFSTAVEQSPACIVVTDLNANIQYVNPQFVQLTGYSREEAIGKNPRILKTDRTSPETYMQLWAALTSGKTWYGEFCNKKKNGELYWESAAIAPIKDDKGDVTGYVAVKEDITEHKRVEEELRFRSIVLATQQETSLDGILVVDAEARMISHNRRFVEMWGIPDEIMASGSDERALQFVLEKIADADAFLKSVRHLYEHRNKTNSYIIELKDGRVFERYSAPMFDAEHKYYGRVWYFRDITEAARYRKLLERLSATDGLTGIANRRNFDDTLAREWRRAIRDGSIISLLMCDIDFFKLYNDHYGHLAGDDCLRRIAAALASCARRPADLAARYGGEEFVCLLPATDAPGAMQIAESLRRSVEQLDIPHERSSVAPHVTISVGVATIAPQRGQLPSELVRRADERLYEAKKNGRNRIEAG